MPAHYLKQFHAKYQTEEKLEELIKENKVKNWARLHINMSRQYRPENPDLPMLDPWVNSTKPPAEQFILERNPYFHRIDRDGRQLALFRSLRLQCQLVVIDPGQDRRRRDRSAGDQYPVRGLYLPQRIREAPRDQGLSVGAHARLARRAFSQSQLRGPGVARRAPGRALPPSAVACHRPARDQHGDVLRSRPSECRYDAAAKPAVPARICRRVDRPRSGPGQCDARRNGPRQAR